MNILSKCKSSFANTSSKLPLVQYGINIFIFPASTDAPINVIKFSWRTSLTYEWEVVVR